MEAPKTEDRLSLYEESFTSRLLLGTGRYDSPSLLADAIRAAAPAMLFSEIEVQKKNKGTDRPPLMPPPGSDQSPVPLTEKAAVNAPSKPESQAEGKAKP